MARTVYRVYLYTVWLSLLVFAAVATVVFLTTVLGLTPLRGGTYYEAPAPADLVQVTTFALIAWVITATLGGLHYWLIRRDMAADPGAGGDVVRALSLNGVEAIAALTAIPTAALTIEAIGIPQQNTNEPLAIVIVSIGLFALMEWERRRAPAAPGEARTLQRLHFYGVQLIALFIATGFWLNTVGYTLIAILRATGQCGTAPEDCYVANAPAIWRSLAGHWGATLWVTVAWLGYGLFARRDTPSVLRQLLHYVGFAFGLILVLAGLDRAATLLLRALLGMPVAIYDITGQFDFLSPVITGLVIVVTYAFWLLADARHSAEGPRRLGLTTQAITAGVLAAPFWIGCASTLHALVEASVPGGTQPQASDWASAVAALLTGSGYLVFVWRMRHRSQRAGYTLPRKVLVLTLLGAGTLTLAVGLAILLYAVTTQALGAPVADWQANARSGAVMLAVGFTLTGIYLPLARSEVWTGASATEAEAASKTKPEAALASVPPTSPEPPTAPGSGDLERVLDDLLTGKLTRDEAAARIRTLTGPQT